MIIDVTFEEGGPFFTLEIGILEFFNLMDTGQIRTKDIAAAKFVVAEQVVRYDFVVWRRNNNSYDSNFISPWGV